MEIKAYKELIKKHEKINTKFNELLTLKYLNDKKYSNTNIKNT